jgi:hypothetical protein
MAFLPRGVVLYFYQTTMVPFYEIRLDFILSPNSLPVAKMDCTHCLKQIGQ